MAKFNTAGIEGFENMSAEDKVKALLNADIPENVDMSQFVSKATADKYASEAADWKKKYNSKLTDDEQKKAAEEAEKKELEDKYTELLKKTTITEFKSKYLGMGYAEKDAQAMAEAQYSGDSSKMFELMTAHAATMKEQIKNDLLKDTPKPEGAGGKPDVKTPDILIAEQLGKSAAESNKAANDIINKYIGG